MTPILLVVALSGCTTSEVPIGPPVGSFIEDGSYEVTGFEAVGAVGNAPVETVIRAVNRWGASVSSAPTGVSVGGTSVTIPFDSLGYGTVRVESPGTTVVDDGTDVVEVTALDSDWPGFGLSRAFEAPAPSALAAGGLTNGSVVAIGRELFYVGPEMAPHRVLNTDNPIRGIQAGHINVDGIEDVVVWSETTVYLMRGRLGGGLAFGAALTADPDDKGGAYRVGGAAVGELTGDNLPDLVIAWSSEEGTSKLDEWHGNGLFGFKPAEPRNLPAIPISVSIGDTTGEGKNQVTVLSENGEWARFIAGSTERYMPIGPRTPEEVSIELGSTVEAWGDLNGDGGDEMWFLGPLTPDAVRKVVIVDLVGEKIEFLPLNPMAAQIGRADLDGNEVIDHVELHSTRALRALSHDPTASNYTPRALAELPTWGPLTIKDNLDLDGIPDLFVAGDDFWWWWRGHNDPNNSEVFWQLGTQAMVEADDTIGPIVAAELDGDAGTQEILGFRQGNGGGTNFTIWSIDRATQTVSVLGETVASAGGLDPVDLVQCGTRAYAALEGQLMRFDLADPANPVVGGNNPGSGTRVDCDPSGALGGELAVLDNGTIEIRNANLQVQSTLAAGGAVDIAFGDVGAGMEVAHCSTANCSIVLWDYGSGAAFVTGSDNQLSVDDGGLQPLVGHGAVSVGDVDGDGNQDLVAAGSDGLFTVYRSTGDGWGAPELFHTPNPPVGAAAIGDADGDGHADLWVRDLTDRLVFSTAPMEPSDDPGTGTGTTP